MTARGIVECLIVAAMTVSGCADRVGRDESRDAPDTTQSVAAVQEAAAQKAGMAMKEHRSGEWTPGLSQEEKQTLFAIAEDTLKWCVAGKREPFAFDAYSITEKLKVPTATFVTLKAGEHLRGCIGSLAPVAALHQSIHDNAINAALHDYRFQPVTPAELPGIDVHISILSPIEPIASLDEFLIGRHGIIIEKGSHRAVYLPEVAIEQGWTREETLSSLSMKAGMRPDAWREGASFKVFSSVVLSR